MADSKTLNGNWYIIVTILAVCGIMLLSGVQTIGREHLGSQSREDAVTEILLTEPVELPSYAKPIDCSFYADEKKFPELSYTVYKVEKGDVVSVLADKFGLSQDTIISVNSIKQSRLIQIGQYLKIPSMPGILYTTRKEGETVDDIAKKYRVDAEKCSYVNSIPLSEKLDEGTSLFIPDAQLDWVTRQEINGDLFVKPIRARYYFSSYYGWRDSPFTGDRTFHNGVDMAASHGTLIYAALSGTVTSAGWSNVYGNYVMVTHHSGYRTLYGHLSSILVKKGASVTTASKIGRVGNTGMSTGDHLHFSVFKNGRAVNPTGLWR